MGTESAKAAAPRLLILSRDSLLAATGDGNAANDGAVLRRLAHLTRRGCHLLLIASEPDQWFPTRSSGDNVLTAQAKIRERIQQFGGDLDGIYYVPRSRFSESRNRSGALSDILDRYHCEAAEALLVSGSERLLDAATDLGMRIRDTRTRGAPGDAGALERVVEDLG